MIRLGRLRHIGLRTRAAIDARMHPPGGEPACNICGCKLRGEEALWSQREVPSCHVCKSTLRFRSLMAALQLRLHDRPEVALAGAAPDKGITGLGMSDASVYSYWLERKFSYRNTFFHTRPYLDIRNPGSHYLAANDFVISSDVLEHVNAPLDYVFANLHALLRPGGALVFTVPYTLDGQTTEHFPGLHDFEIIGRKSSRQLINRDKDGRETVYSDLCFHGGDGATLELRIFSLPDLLSHLQRAGFKDVRIHSQDYPEWGIVHADKLGAPISAIA